MDGTAGVPATGADIRPSVPKIRNRPGRSVTSIRPSGSHAIPHGVSSPVATSSKTNVSPAALKSRVGDPAVFRAVSDIGRRGAAGR